MKPIRPFILFAALTAPATAAPGVWIEAESPLRSTFPPGSPFAPEDDAQRAKLSGGAWLNAAGKTGRNAPAASYRLTITPENAGQPHRLWVRKFWHHGGLQMAAGRW